MDAQEQNFVEIPLEAFHNEKSVELVGLISSQTLNISIPRGWLLGEENWLEIKFRKSDLLDLAGSSVTISLNGSHVSSHRLTQLSETKQQILIPANMFTQGNNTLTFAGTLYLPDDQGTNCQDWDNPARWLSIEPGGLLHLSFVRRELSMDLSDFPQVFIEPLEEYLPDSARRQTLIVLPEDSTQDDLTSLSIISYTLGSTAETNYDWKPEIVTMSQLRPDIAANRNIVFIGETPPEFQDLVSKDKNYVALLPSPRGVGNAILLIGDKNRQDGFSPASVFSDPARGILLHGNVAYLDPYVPTAPQPFLDNFSFEDLGYPDRTARGIGQQNLIYSLYIPYDIDPTQVKLNLHLVHSPDLDLQNSSFTVYLNGYSVAGILPNALSSTGTPITIGLPAQKFRPGINFVRIRLDLYPPYTSCTRAPEAVWATILNSTTLEVAHRKHPPIPSLEHFPLPFGEYPGVLYVIPDQYDQIDLDYVSRLSFMFGTSARKSEYPPGVITASKFLQMGSSHHNVILLGLPSRNLATMSANALLPQPFTDDGKALQRGYGVYLPTADADASLGLMQIIPSPWANGGTVLVLTGNDQKGLGWTLDVILDTALRDQFAGNVMVIGSANRSEASGESPGQQGSQPMFQQIADASNIPLIGPVLQRSGQAFLIPALFAVGIALILVVSILWVWRRVQNRNTPDIIEKSDEPEQNEL
ncbi:MAG TPA: cellulose biosynthesis cyclic di-GMP-binding regulatory protein BcsB [Anaerolineales bacterium]|nr:cellulose biosynthesis cyclic di-GMP-binding regulatory protein BcsB [Anaerolineales bacterium]